MRIICIWPQSESTSPLVLTALKLANRVELFAAKLRPFAQQRSPFRDYSKSSPRSGGIRRNLTCRAQGKAASFTRVWSRTSVENAGSGAGGELPPTGFLEIRAQRKKCLQSPGDQQPSRRAVVCLGRPSTSVTSFVARLTGKFTFASIFPALHQGSQEIPNRAVTDPKDLSVTNNC